MKRRIRLSALGASLAVLATTTLVAAHEAAADPQPMGEWRKGLPAEV
jgi:hypothetical protein